MATSVVRPPRPAFRTALANRFGTACLNVKVGEFFLQDRANSDSSFPRRLIISCSCLCHRAFGCFRNDALIEHYFGIICLRPCFPAFTHTITLCFIPTHNSGSVPRPYDTPRENLFHVQAQDDGYRANQLRRRLQPCQWHFGHLQPRRPWEVRLEIRPGMRRSV